MKRGTVKLLSFVGLSVGIAVFALMVTDTDAAGWGPWGVSSGSAVGGGPGGSGGGTWTSDLDGSTNYAQWVAAISGYKGEGGTVNLNNVPTFQVTGTGPAGAAAQSETFQGQAVNATDGGAGNWVFNTPAPTGAGFAGLFQIQSGGLTQIAEGSYAAVPGGSTTFSSIWMEPNVAPTSSNFSIAASATGLSMNAGSVLAFDIAANEVLAATSSQVAVAQPVGGISGGNAFTWCEATQAVQDGGTQALANTVYNCPHLKFTGGIGANTTIAFPSTIGACWDLDFTGVTFNAHTITLQANSVNWGTTVSAVTNNYHVCYSDGAKLYGNTMTP